MRGTVLLVCACGCNILFPLREHPPAALDPDAIDAVADASSSKCSTAGAPKFPGSVTTIVQGNYTDYSPSIATKQAVTSFGTLLEQGDLDADMYGLVTLEPADGTTPSHGRLSPGGDELFVSARAANGSQTIEIYQRNLDTWTHVPQASLGLPNVIAAADSVTVSAPTSTTPREVIVELRQGGVTSFYEYIESGGPWMQGNAYDASTFQQTTISDPSVSEDGARLVFIATIAGEDAAHIFYADRILPDHQLAATFDPFSRVSRLDTIVDTPSHPYLTNDCARLYVVGVQALHYLEQP